MSDFENLVEAAFAEIPADFRGLITNVEIAVKARPGREAGRWRNSRTLLGLYCGPDRAEMSGPYAGALPPGRILLYRDSIAAGCLNLEDLSRAVRTTLRHELAHHFGISDAQLKRIWPEGA